jgi:hypothetical protein
MQTTYKGLIKNLVNSKKMALVSEAAYTGLKSSETNIVAGLAATHGSAAIDFATYQIVGTALTGIPASTYKIKLKIDAAAPADSSIIVGASSTWTNIVTLITALAGVSAAIVGGNIVITSDATGAASAIVIADGTSTGLIAAMNTATSDTALFPAGTAGAAATKGHTIITFANLIVGTANAGLTTGTYNIQVGFDGAALANYAISGTSSDTWTTLVGKINTAITAKGTAAIVSGAIVVASNTTGVTSAVVVADGATHGLLLAVAEETVSVVYGTRLIKGNFSAYSKGSHINYTYDNDITKSDNKWVTIV